MRLVLSSFDYLPTWSSTNSLLGSIAACLEGGHHLFLLNQDNIKVQNNMTYSFLLHVFGNCQLCVDLKKMSNIESCDVMYEQPDKKIIFLIWIKKRRLFSQSRSVCLWTIDNSQL